MRSYGNEVNNKYMKEKNSFSDTLVEEYNLFGEVFPAHEELQTALADSVSEHFPDKEKENTFLDMGAGYGFSSRLVAERLPKSKYILNDFDTELLNRSDQYMSGYNFEKRPGDIEKVIKEIPDASLDGIYTAWVLHNFPPEKRAVVMAEVGRVLKTGGVFVNLEKVGNPGPEREAALAQSLIDFTPFVTKYNRPDLYLEWIRHNLRDEEKDLLFSDTENEKLLKENGFSWEYVKHILLEKVVVAVKS